MVSRNIPSDRRPRVAAVVEKPIQYFVPHYRQITEDGRIDLEVIYLTDKGVTPYTYHGAVVKQEQSILDGYRWQMVERSRWLGGMNNFRGLRPKLAGALARGAYDAVWFHGYNILGNWIGLASCVARGTPILFRGESENFFPRPAWKNLAKRALLQPLFSHVDAFLYIGTENRKFYREYHVPEERLFPVPYGVDNAWLRGTPAERAEWRSAIRAELGLGADTIVYLNCSKHRVEKRAHDAVAAFCQQPPDANAALLMLGDGELRGQIEQVYRDNQRGHRVVFLGLRPYSELRKYMAASDVLVFPSEETWGMAVSEALASGLAILCGDRMAGGPDLVHHDVNGYKFRSRDASDLARYMRLISSDRQRIAAMQAESLRIADTMSFQVMTDGLIRAVEYALRRTTE